MLHIDEDLEVLKKFPDKYFDWAYIDSSHKYEHTKNELELLKHKVKDSGVIAGDDYYPEEKHRHHGVYKAVRKFLLSNPYKLSYSSLTDRQWALIRD